MYTFAISFKVRRSRTNKAIEKLFAKITLNGDETEIRLGGEVPPDLWQSKQDQFKGKSDEIRSTNQYIENVRFRLTDCYRQLESAGKPFSAQDVKALFEGKRKPDPTPEHSGHTFLELIDYHNEKNPDGLKEGSLKNYRTTRDYVARFIEHQYGKKDCFLTELNFEFIVDLKNYIEHNPIYMHDPCTGNGLPKHLERIIKMGILAKDKLKWIKVDLFEGFENKRRKSKVIPLSLYEFKLIEQRDFSDPTLELTKDLFVFSTYTGLAYCDVINLSPENLSFGDEGKIWILSYRQKSEEFFPVPMLSPAVALLEKYRNDLRATVRGMMLPYLSNQEINSSLKIIGEIAGVKKSVHFHLARRLFGKEITLKHGVPITTVQKMMGHKKLSTTRQYAETDEDMIEADMRELEKKLNFENS